MGRVAKTYTKEELEERREKRLAKLRVENKKYYDASKVELNIARNARYKFDREYREKIQSQQRESYRRKRNAQGHIPGGQGKHVKRTAPKTYEVTVRGVRVPTELVGTALFTKAIGVSKATLFMWSREKAIPDSLYTVNRTWRLYTYDQINIAAQIMAKFFAGPVPRSVRWATHPFLDDLREAWGKLEDGFLPETIDKMFAEKAAKDKQSTDGDQK